MTRENINSKNFYKDIPNEDKRMYRSMFYVQIYTHILGRYCMTEEIGSWEELHKSEYHKAKIKEDLDNMTDKEIKDLIDNHGNDGSFIWEEFISDYDSCYEGLTINQGENKAPFLKVMDEVFDKAKKDGTLDQPGITINDIEKLYMYASDQALEKDGMTVEEFFGGKAS